MSSRDAWWVLGSVHELLFPFNWYSGTMKVAAWFLLGYKVYEWHTAPYIHKHLGQWNEIAGVFPNEERKSNLHWGLTAEPHDHSSHGLEICKMQTLEPVTLVIVSLPPLTNPHSIQGQTYTSGLILRQARTKVNKPYCDNDQSHCEKSVSDFL